MAAPAEVAPAEAPPRRRGVRGLLVVGWTLVGAGVVVLLYVAYALFFTGLETERAQSAMLEDWEREIGALVPAAPRGMPDIPDLENPAPVVIGEAIAVIAFQRPGSDQRPVTDELLAVVAGVGYTQLQSGPGHYPETASPGESGNFAVAGHRVTWAAPFYNLDELREGDEIHVWDRSGNFFVYTVRESRILRPHDNWVLGRDPLDTGNPTITLTTCHPRFSNRERLVAFGELST